MESSKIYKWGFFSLLCLNIALITMFFVIKNKNHGPRGLHNKVVEILALQEEQLPDFKCYAFKHSQQMREIERQQVDLLEKYFDAFSQSANDSTTLSLVDSYAALERKKIEQTGQHFNDVEALLNPEQRERYPDFVRKVSSLLLMKNSKFKPKGKREDHQRRMELDCTAK